MFELWKLQDFAPGEGSAAGAHSEEYNDSAWIDVTVPGDVHQALVAAGRIEDPFYDRNELKCSWIEGREWWYRLQFQAPPEPLQPGERYQLVFQGLDTFATVWLNGERLGQHANMFREAVFDLSNKLRIGKQNCLALCFDPPLHHVDPNSIFRPWGHSAERVFMRKAQFGFGWDWGPRLPTIGIWRPVELRRQNRACIQGAHFFTLRIDPDQDLALVGARVDLERFATDQPLNVTVRLSGPGETIEQAMQVLKTEAFPKVTAYLQVQHPRLWWTHDLGKPELYDLQVTLSQEGHVLDRQQLKVGIRTLALDQSPDPEEPGTRFFRFVMNGVPIFAKGADWIPADSFVGAIPAGRYEALLSAARDANMNMLRVWGGGIYEHDVFYDLCDRLGILVWQDFMFACAAYPDHDPAFTAEVEAEAHYQVRRLRSHPCLALWCGNNENQSIHDRIFWNRLDYPVPGALFYDHILPQVTSSEDGQTPYWPGSPYGGSDYNSMDDGDRHDWWVWHGEIPRRFGEEPRGDQSPAGVSYLHYAEDRGRFISEFGMHAAPVFETLRRNIPADGRYHHSASMDHHNKDNPKDKGDNLMLTVTGLPKELDEYIDFSMIAQAEGLKFGIEHFRRRKPHCSGTLFWQLNDCWPVLSWSVLDYYGFGKAGYYYAQRVYAPVLASCKGLVDGGLELWVTNDRLGEVADNVSVRLRTFAGKTLWEESLPIRVSANTSSMVGRFRAGEISPGADRYLSVSSAKGSFPTNRHFFVPIKELQRIPVKPEMIVAQVDEHNLRVELSAPAFAYFVHLLAPHEATRFSDNYLDLEAGEPCIISVFNPEVSLAPEDITLHWR